MNPKKVWPSLILALLLIDGQSVFAKTSYQKTIENLCGLNQKNRTLCSEAPSASPTATPTKNTLPSKVYFNKVRKDGVSAEIDWKWINGLGKMDPMMPKEGDVFYQMEIDLLKKSKSKKQMLMMRLGKCWINMNGTYGLNETQDKIILTESSSFDLSYPESCKKSTEGCITINGKTYRVIAKNKADPPMTKETMNTDYLKPIRDAEQLIEEKCK